AVRPQGSFVSRPHMHGNSGGIGVQMPMNPGQPMVYAQRPVAMPQAQRPVTYMTHPMSMSAPSGQGQAAWAASQMQPQHMSFAGSMSAPVVVHHVAPPMEEYFAREDHSPRPEQDNQDAEFLRLLDSLEVRVDLMAQMQHTRNQIQARAREADVPPEFDQEAPGWEDSASQQGDPYQSNETQSLEQENQHLLYAQLQALQKHLRGWP
ncbi:unnamed protein product, partial [Polarella glacialis]